MRHLAPRTPLLFPGKTKPFGSQFQFRLLKRATETFRARACVETGKTQQVALPLNTPTRGWTNGENRLSVEKSFAAGKYELEELRVFAYCKPGIVIVRWRCSWFLCYSVLNVNWLWDCFALYFCIFDTLLRGFLD